MAVCHEIARWLLPPQAVPLPPGGRQVRGYAELYRICRKAKFCGGAGWAFLPKARPLSKHVPLWLWLRCRYPAGRAGLLDAGLSLRVLLAKAKKPARSRFGDCLDWWLLDLIHRSRGPPSPSTGKAGITSWLFAMKSPAGSFHRKRSPFLPEEGRFAAMQNCIETIA